MQKSNKDLRNGKLSFFYFVRYVRISVLCDVSSGAVKYAGHCDILVFTKMDFLDAFVIIVA